MDILIVISAVLELAFSRKSIIQGNAVHSQSFVSHALPKHCDEQ